MAVMVAADHPCLLQTPCTGSVEGFPEGRGSICISIRSTHSKTATATELSKALDKSVCVKKLGIP